MDPATGQGHSFATSLYWCIYTLTTVGYGDVGVATPEGRVFVALFILTVLFIASAVINIFAEIQVR